MLVEVVVKVVLVEVVFFLLLQSLTHHQYNYYNQYN